MHVWSKRTLQPPGSHDLETFQSEEPRVLRKISRLHRYPAPPRSVTAIALIGITTSVLEALATRTCDSFAPTVILASTKTSVFPARNTSARQIKSGPEAGRRNETLFSTVITSRSSGTTDAAAPPQV